MLPDFNRLKVFYYIFSNKSVANAAKELHITQSAVSQRLQKLEAEIETRLFIRLHKRLVPTPAGERLFTILNPFMGQLENCISNIQREHEGPFGLLRIGAPVEFGKRYFPKIFSSFRNKYPDVSFVLSLGHPTVLLPLLGEGHLDFAFADIFSKKGEFSRELSIYSIEPLIVEELILVCSGVYYERNLKKDNSFKSLIEGDYISYQKQYPALKSWFNHHFKRKSINLNIVMTVENVEGVVEGVKHDMGLGIIPSHLIHEKIDQGDFIHIETSKKEIINRISLVQLLDKIPSITEKAFLGHFNKEIESIVSR
jgi:DNA-binding transcriptional LysR family regulator